jgi:transcriptional regulator with XRE-family HTH domain
VPFSPQRFQRLCELKSVKQLALAQRIGVSQSQISDCNRGIGPTIDLLERLATGLDSTTDFLLGRGSSLIDSSDDFFRTVVSRMAYDVWEAGLSVSDDERRRCNRVLGHPAAPITAHAWAILSEQIRLAIGPETKDFKIIAGGA